MTGNREHIRLKTLTQKGIMNKLKGKERKLIDGVGYLKMDILRAMKRDKIIKDEEIG